MNLNIGTDVLHSGVDEISKILFLGNGNRLFAMGYENGNIRLNNTKTGRSLALLEGFDTPITALTADKDRLVSGCTDATIRIWDTEQAKCICELPKPKPAIRMTYKEKKEVYLQAVAMQKDPAKAQQAAAMFSAKTAAASLGASSSELGHFGRINALTMSLQLPYSNQSILGSCSTDKQIKFWEMDNFELIHTNSHAHYDSISALTAIPCTPYFISASWDRSIRIWDIRTFRQISSYPNAHPDFIATLTILPNFGKYSPNVGIYDLMLQPPRNKQERRLLREARRGVGDTNEQDQEEEDQENEAELEEKIQAQLDQSEDEDQDWEWDTDEFETGDTIDIQSRMEPEQIKDVKEVNKERKSVISATSREGSGIVNEGPTASQSSMGVQNIKSGEKERNRGWVSVDKFLMDSPSASDGIVFFATSGWDATIKLWSFNGSSIVPVIPHSQLYELGRRRAAAFFEQVKQESQQQNMALNSSVIDQVNASDKTAASAALFSANDPYGLQELQTKASQRMFIQSKTFQVHSADQPESLEQEQEAEAQAQAAAMAAAKAALAARNQALQQQQENNQGLNNNQQQGSNKQETEDTDKGKKSFSLSSVKPFDSFTTPAEGGEAPMMSNKQLLTNLYHLLNSKTAAEEAEAMKRQRLKKLLDVSTIIVPPPPEEKDKKNINDDPGSSAYNKYGINAGTIPTNSPQRKTKQQILADLQRKEEERQEKIMLARRIRRGEIILTAEEQRVKDFMEKERRQRMRDWLLEKAEELTHIDTDAVKVSAAQRHLLCLQSAGVIAASFDARRRAILRRKYQNAGLFHLGYNGDEEAIINLHIQQSEIEKVRAEKLKAEKEAAEEQELDEKQRKRREARRKQKEQQEFLKQQQKQGKTNGLQDDGLVGMKEGDNIDEDEDEDGNDAVYQEMDPLKSTPMAGVNFSHIITEEGLKTGVIIKEEQQPEDQQTDAEKKAQQEIIKQTEEKTKAFQKEKQKQQQQQQQQQSKQLKSSVDLQQEEKLKEQEELNKSEIEQKQDNKEGEEQTQIEGENKEIKPEDQPEQIKENEVNEQDKDKDKELQAEQSPQEPPQQDEKKEDKKQTTKPKSGSSQMKSKTKSTSKAKNQSAKNSPKVQPAKGSPKKDTKQGLKPNPKSKTKTTQQQPKIETKEKEIEKPKEQSNVQKVEDESKLQTGPLVVNEQDKNQNTSSIDKQNEQGNTQQIQQDNNVDKKEGQQVGNINSALQSGRSIQENTPNLLSEDEQQMINERLQQMESSKVEVKKKKKKKGSIYSSMLQNQSKSQDDTTEQPSKPKLISTKTKTFQQSLYASGPRKYMSYTSLSGNPNSATYMSPTVYPDGGEKLPRLLEFQSLHSVMSGAHSTFITGIALYKERFLLSCSADRTVMIWDAWKGERIYTSQPQISIEETYGPSVPLLPSHQPYLNQSNKPETEIGGKLGNGKEKSIINFAYQNSLAAQIPEDDEDDQNEGLESGRQKKLFNISGDRKQKKAMVGIKEFINTGPTPGNFEAPLPPQIPYSSLSLLASSMAKQISVVDQPRVWVAQDPPTDAICTNPIIDSGLHENPLPNSVAIAAGKQVLIFT